MNTTPIVLGCLPVSISLSAQDPEQRAANEQMLLATTGLTFEQCKRLSDTAGLPLRRVGSGSGVRYFLDLADYSRWLRRLPAD